MGSNQSKFHPLVETQMLAKWHLARQKDVQKGSFAPIIEVPVESLCTACTTPDKDFKADVLAHMQRGWTPSCAKHGIHGEKNVRRAILVATGLGAMFVWGDKWHDLKKSFGDTEEEWAIRTMWTLEDEIHHPWHILRMFVLNRYCCSKTQLEQQITQEVLKAKQMFKAQICWHCHKAKLDSCALKKCSLCGIATYCSKACQKKDWLYHKQTCAKLIEEPQGSHEEEQKPLDCIDRALANPQKRFW